MLKPLVPVLAAISTAFLVTGAMLAALPLFVHQELGFGADVVGIIAGAQFVAALASRVWAGQLSDRIGPRRVMLLGLGLVLAAGIACLASVALARHPGIAVGVLLVGRAALGGGESCIITAGQTWGLALVGADKAAAVIGWAGTALYLALTAGGPFGGVLSAAFGFAGVAGLALLAPLLALPLILTQKDTRRDPTTTRDAVPVMRRVLSPGLAAGAAGMVYAALAFFSGLYFSERGWVPTWAPFSAFALALVLMRAAFSGVPDRLGTRRTVLLFLVVQVVGLAFLMLAQDRDLAIVGAFLAGSGYSFIYPALGRDAVRRVPSAAMGRAVAYYSACFDLSMAASGLALGQLAAQVGLQSVFAAAILGAILAFVNMALSRVEQPD